MSKNTIFIALFGIIPFFLLGQPLERATFPIFENGQELPLALAGGFNLPQFSGVDLDNDGVEDLFVFDRGGNAMASFKYQNGMNYDFAPDLLEYFPRLNKWAIMRDYNQDGAPDIFAYTTQLGVAGIEVHKGYWKNNKLAFTKLSFGQTFDVLYYQGANNPINLYVSSIDIPTFSDIDNDGDEDILTFASSGGYVVYFKNLSQEQGYGNDTLIFKKEDPCWGKFYESGQSTKITLSNDPNTCAEAFLSGGISDRHAGSTLLAMDLNLDGKKELFLGDVSFNNVVLLFNTGTPDKAFMTDQDTLFPSYHPIEIPVFPSIFGLDIDHDGKKDVLSSPNAGGISQSRENAWLYRKIDNTSQFEFIQNDFLVGKMLDLGTGAYPTFADVDGDGLYDMVIGNSTFFDPAGALDSRLMLYKNVGSYNTPKFELVDDDFLSLKAESNEHWNFTPNFGDLDGDGDLDLLVGEYLGGMYYFENTAEADQPMQFAQAIFPFKNIDIGLVATPFIVDVDEDGLTDIIIGERNGNVNLFKNIGSAGSPDFNSDQAISPNSPFWGNIDTRKAGSVTGYSVPRLWKENGIFKLFVGSQSGQIYEYTDIENNLNTAFTKVTEDYGTIKDGGTIYPEFIDLNNDGHRELIIGNERGGITAFQTNLTSPVSTYQSIKPTLELKIEPNPTKDIFKPIFGESNTTRGRLSIFNITGKLSMQKTIFSGEPIATSHLPKGVYIIKINTESAHYTGRLSVE